MIGTVQYTKSVYILLSALITLRISTKQAQPVEEGLPKIFININAKFGDHTLETIIRNLPFIARTVSQ